MRWTHLHPIGIPDWFGTKLRNRASELNEQIESVLSERGTLEAAVARARGEDPATVDVGNVCTFPAFEDSRLTLLQRELKLRRDLAPFWGEYAKARSQAAGKASDDARKLEAKLRGGLRDLGFVVDGPTPSWGLPGFLASHSELRAARERARALASPGGASEPRRDNEEAIRRLEEELATAVKRGLPA